MFPADLKQKKIQTDREGLWEGKNINISFYELQREKDYQKGF